MTQRTAVVQTIIGTAIRFITNLLETELVISLRLLQVRHAILKDFFSMQIVRYLQSLEKTSRSNSQQFGSLIFDLSPILCWH